MRNRITVKFAALFVLISVAVVSTATIVIRRGAAASSWAGFERAGIRAGFGELMPIVPQTSTLQPTVITPRAAATSQPALNLPLTKPQIGEYEGDSPLPIHPPHAAPNLPVTDPVQQTAAPTAAVATANQTFDGMTQAEACGSCIPPDPVGAVGPNHYVEMVNSSFAVYSKTGTKLSGPTDINSLFQSLPASAPCDRRVSFRSCYRRRTNY